jgi:hypothetical protein
MRKHRWLLLGAGAMAYAGLMVGVDRVEWYHPAADSLHISGDFSVQGYIGIWMFVASLSIGYSIGRQWTLLLALIIPLDHWLIAQGDTVPIYGYAPLKPEAVARDWTFFAAFIAMGFFVRRHERRILARGKPVQNFREESS